MYERFNIFTNKYPRSRKVLGWFLVVIGFFAIITPLTPGGTLFFVGLELLGLRIIFTQKVRRVFTRKEKVTFVSQLE